MIPKNEVQCHSRCGTTKAPPYSTDLEHRSHIAALPFSGNVVVTLCITSLYDNEQSIKESTPNGFTTNSSTTRFRVQIISQAANFAKEKSMYRVRLRYFSTQLRNKVALNKSTSAVGILQNKPPNEPGPLVTAGVTLTRSPQSASP